MGKNGLVPSKLFFLIPPRFPSLSTDLPAQEGRMKAIKIAQAKMNLSVAERLVVEARTKNIPPAFNRTYQWGKEVLVYSEQNKEKLGPFTVVYRKKRMITVQNQDQSIHELFNAFQVKLFDHKYEQNLYQLKFSEPIGICITENIHPRDQPSKDFCPSIKKEIKVLINFKTWKAVCCIELPEAANILGSLLALAFKNKGRKSELWKARLIVQGHRDHEKPSLFHENPVVKLQSMRILMSIAAIFCFCTKS